MAEYYDKINEEWEEVELEPCPTLVTGDDLLVVLGHEARCVEALAESIAWQLAKDAGAPGPSAETYAAARMVASRCFYE